MYHDDDDADDDDDDDDGSSSSCNIFFVNRRMSRYQSSLCRCRVLSALSLLTNGEAARVYVYV